jgi:hypothetical protein
MGEVVKYLQRHGVPFEYTRLKHNQPHGILRGLLAKKNLRQESVEMKKYLENSSAESKFNANKQK